MTFQIETDQSQTSSSIDLHFINYEVAFLLLRTIELD